MANLYPSDPSYTGPPTTNPDLTQAERLARIEEHLGLTVAAPSLPAPPEAQPVDENGDLIPVPPEPVDERDGGTPEPTPGAAP